MTAPADFTTRVRDEMFSMYVAYQVLARRVDDLTDEVVALGGAGDIYDVDDFPTSDGITLQDLGAAFVAVTALIGEPTLEQKQAIIKMRRN